MNSERLTYEPIGPSNLDGFHRLVRDQHVRRYLLDGALFPPEWSAERASESQALMERRGVGIWLARLGTSGEVIGFCGFMEIPSVDPEPQLVYALYGRFTGNGLATEMARASITHARKQPGFKGIIASVDEVNAASRHILEKLGFETVSIQKGSFGNMFVLRLHWHNWDADNALITSTEQNADFSRQ
jgi:[ribosomal protein S5]-alanine N-acetyltransferase